MTDLNAALDESESQLLTNSDYESDRTGAKARAYIAAARNILYLVPKVHEVGGSNNAIRKEIDTSSLQLEIESARTFLGNCSPSGYDGIFMGQLSCGGRYE